MRVIKEDDRIDYMNSISLHEFVGEGVVVDCEKFVYTALISRYSMKILSLRPIQQTDVERYGFDPRVLYMHRDELRGTPPMISYGQLHGSTHRDESGMYPPQQEPQAYTQSTAISWVTTVGERTSEQESEYGLLRRMYNRIRR